MGKMNTELPNFRFALREDLKNDKSFLPRKGEEKASGWDVRAAQEDRYPLVIEPFQYVKIPLGFRGFCPEGWWYELRPRSSSFAKRNLNSLYGVIDETYESELVFAAQYIPELKFLKSIRTILTDGLPEATRIFDKTAYNTLTIEFGEAIGQIVPVRRQEMIVEELSNEEYDKICSIRNGSRKDGGFGSTDGK
jgi:dUTPase